MISMKIALKCANADIYSTMTADINTARIAAANACKEMVLMKGKGRRHQICWICGREWNVSVKASVSRTGYICPKCRGKKVHNEDNGNRKY